MTTDTAKYWTVPQVADLLAVHADKVTTWLRRGELVGINVADRAGRRPRWRIADAELQRFIRARQTTVTPTTGRALMNAEDVPLKLARRLAGSAFCTNAGEIIVAALAPRIREMIREELGRDQLGKVA